MPTSWLDDQRTHKGLAGSGLEWQARVAPDKLGMLVLDVFKVH